MADQRSPLIGFDLDTSGSTEYVVGYSPRGAGGSGSVALHSDPIALAEDLANPTVGGLAVYGLVFDGSTWDRMKGDSTDGLLVNLGTNNDVSITGSVDTELPAAASLTDDFANPTAPGVGAFGMLWDGSTWDRMKGDSTDGVLVNLGSNNDVSITGTVDTELPAAATLADATANPSTTTVGAMGLGWNGSTWDRLATANTGRLQVDVITGGGAEAPTSPVNSTVTSASLAAGASADLDTPSADSKKLSWIDIWCSVPWKGELFTVDDGTPSTRKAVFGGPPFVAVQYQPKHRNFITLGANAGLDAFRLTVTNLDDNKAADIHAVFHYED